ncbi:MAG TPA: ABC transporter permease [Chitinophagaceae bacterium]|nr:ABC transporter permease [Chitinophagaceae bacterium]
MIKNFFKIAFRNLLRNKGFSIINISGLAIGMASAMLILLWIQNEVGYDQFHAKKDRLYMAYNREAFDGKLQCWPNTPYPLAGGLVREYPEIEAASTCQYNTFLFTVGDKHLRVHGNFVDTSFLNMFSFPLASGNPSKCLDDINNIAITQQLAKKLFGNDDAMGKVIKIDDTINCTVTAVLKDLPNNTSFNFEYLLPMSYAKRIGWTDDAWDDNGPNTYVLLRPNVTEAAADAKIKNISKRHLNGTEQVEVFLHPVTKWRLYSKFENGKITGGKIETVRMFGLIAGLILLIACINFMNLSTARSEKRAKEVGIRKVVGAQRQFLISQFLGESILIAFIAGIIAVILVQVSLDGFNLLTNKRLYLDYSAPYFWLAIAGFILLTGILAGSYPAFYLSSFQPVKVLKGTFRKVNALVTPRKVLVVIQFWVAIVLIICTVIIEQQINYAQSRETGYNKNNLIYHMLTGDLDKNYLALRTDLLNSGAVTGVTKTSQPITQNWSDSWGFQWQGKDPNAKIDFDRFCVDENFTQTTGATIAEGRDIDLKKFPSDSTAMVLNESAVKIMGFKNPIGQIVKDGDEPWHVVGVVKDFILRSPYEPVRPMVIEGSKGFFNAVHMRLAPGKPVAESLAAIEKIFKKYNPQYPFEYHFVDEVYALKFANEETTAKLAALFAGLTILISCLGLFGLATYMAENRVKEIGVRKVLGASVAGLTTLMSKDFITLVLIAIIFAVPIAWYAMDAWLKSYSYKTPIHWWVFAGAGAVAVVIALLTVSYQAIKVALANPVRSLRTE